jgi:hypothetical protein
MGTYDQLSPETLRQALKDVTGVDYDVTDAEGQARVAAKIHELLTSDARDYSAELARSIVNQTLSDIPQVEGLPKVAYKLVGFEEGAEDYDADDLPSRAVRTSQLSDFIVSADEVVSPKQLGFDDENVEVKWSSQLVQRWAKFIRSAEHRIPTNTGRVRLELLRNVFSRAPAYRTEQKAKNYDLVSLEDGKDKSTAHFLFESNHLYVVIIVNDSETCRAKVGFDDVNSFSKEMAGAFKGRPELAKGTLAHLLSTLVH